MNAKKIALFILSFLIGAVFLFSGYSKLYPIEPFEFNFVDLGLANWTTAQFIARLLISLEFLLGTLLVLNFKLKKFTLPASLSLLLFFTIYLVVAIIKDGNKGNCGCFGTMLEMTPLESIVKNIILILGTVLLLKFYDGFNWKKANLILIFSLLTSLALPFILNPINIEKSTHFADGAKDYYLPLNTLYKDPKNKAPKVDLTKGKQIVAFLSLTCQHCKIAAFKLQILKKQHPEWPVYFIFNGEDYNLPKFHNDTRSKHVPYSMILGETFIKLSGPYLPAIYLLENSVVKKKYNYLTIDQEELANFLEK